MKKVALITIGKPTSKVIKEQLEHLFADTLLVETYFLSQKKEILQSDADLFLYTKGCIRYLLIEEEAIRKPYLETERVINHKNIKEIISIPKETDVLLVNDSQSTAYEAIQQLELIGLDHVSYHPFYPGCRKAIETSIAITPGEPHLIPNGIEKVIDLGSRILDISTIHEIIFSLDLEEQIEKSCLTDYLKNIVEISKLIDESRRDAQESEKLLERIVNSIDHGIAYIGENNHFINANTNFEKMMQQDKVEFIGKEVSILMEVPCNKLKDQLTWITEINGNEMLVDVQKIHFDYRSGYLMTIQYTDRISKLGHRIRRNQEKKIKQQLHTFEDYLTQNMATKQMLEKAKKFSETEATILIQGENGTGKEILAQAIHSASKRRKGAFVPVNIGALTPALLESELFGYEEGSFTGALKGGKMGIFEIASGGTVFIDEIGDAPLDFQVKLLRVLEEKKIRRVGAMEEIPVDVRVIAATNKDLIELVDQNHFREDLFFRLNILPLNTLPLREKKEDILFLLKVFVKQKFGKGLEFSCVFEDEVIERLMNYQWRGNIRELINLVEYLSLIYDGDPIQCHDLHPYMLKQTETVEKDAIFLEENALWILSTLESSIPEALGRTSLRNRAKQEGYELGEGKIRRLMKDLEGRSLIVSKGYKKGYEITSLGKKVLISHIERE
ncbi:PAS domain S-box-containing protein [Tindallia magadiensis]|uniref:PAS domain S-box-containing protein n=1 Tax=Tindallia magadiensis TaxID=69895 RepID=A0A1I3E0S5_9FIRM|nr:sigma 54-interacting transcriptional regulator [Tindallia magadiensis]SFH92600.1 PAS domain S-box-containing protein [Tindallia magadiensis]